MKAVAFIGIIFAVVVLTAFLSILLYQKFNSRESVNIALSWTDSISLDDVKLSLCKQKGFNGSDYFYNELRFRIGELSIESDIELNYPLPVVLVCVFNKGEFVYEYPYENEGTGYRLTETNRRDIYLDGDFSKFSFASDPGSLRIHTGERARFEIIYSDELAIPINTFTPSSEELVSSLEEFAGGKLFIFQYPPLENSDLDYGLLTDYPSCEFLKRNNIPVSEIEIPNSLESIAIETKNAFDYANGCDYGRA